MTDSQKYRFRIGAYSPKTMPLGHLLRYLTQFQRLLKNPEKVHLLEIERGSTAPAFYIQPGYEDEFVGQIEKVSQGLGNNEQNEAYREIRYLAFEDNASGTKIESPNGAEIIQFPQVERPTVDALEAVIEGVEEAVTVFVSPYKLGRKNANAQKYDAWFSDLKNGKRINAEMSIELGLRMAVYMEKELAVSGVATWSRNSDGDWDIDRFVVRDFDEFHPDSTKETFAAIKQLKDVLPEDIHDQLNKHRHGDE